MSTDPRSWLYLNSVPQPTGRHIRTLPALYYLVLGSIQPSLVVFSPRALVLARAEFGVVAALGLNTPRWVVVSSLGLNTAGTVLRVASVRGVVGCSYRSYPVCLCWGCPWLGRYAPLTRSAVGPVRGRSYEGLFYGAATLLCSAEELHRHVARHRRRIAHPGSRTGRSPRRRDASTTRIASVAGQC